MFIQSFQLQINMPVVCDDREQKVLQSSVPAGCPEKNPAETKLKNIYAPIPPAALLKTNASRIIREQFTRINIYKALAINLLPKWRFF